MTRARFLALTLLGAPHMFRSRAFAWKLPGAALPSFLTCSSCTRSGQRITRNGRHTSVHSDFSRTIHKGDVFFREALRIDPTFARAHFLLARNADLSGDWAAQRAHLKAAVESNPANPQYLVRYAQAHKDSEPARFKELAALLERR